MTTPRRPFRSMILAGLAMPLALGLAACNSGSGDAAGGISGDVVENVAPPAGASWSETAVRTPDGGWLVGNPDAPIKLLEYGSLTCPACALFSTEGSAKLHEDYIDSGRVSYEFRTVLIHGAVDLLLSRVLECAPVEVAVPLADQVWANLDAVTGPFQANQAALEQAISLPENQRFVAMAQASELDQFFAARGISTEQTQACLADSTAVTALATKSQEMSERDGVTGTPTFLLNGTKIDATRWAEVEGALQRAGARTE
ncbi:MAG: thioredoxin domain-containing protein [Pseudomonadota bacterium]